MSMSDDSSSGSSSEFDGPSRAFWAVELVPGKEYTTSLPLDLRITQAVLPASAKDAGRSVVNITYLDEPEKTFALTSLKLDHNESQTLEVALDQDSEIKLTVSGKNPVHLSGYYIPDEEEGMYPDYGSDDGEDFDDEEIESDEDDEEDDQVDDDIQALMLEQQKRKAIAQQNGGNAKKAKVEQQKPKEVAAPQQQQKKAETPNKAAQQQQPKQQQQQKSPAQQTKAFPNGLEITTVQPGTGAEAVKGRMVSVKYVGKLTKNGKIFDASKKPFSFRLGAGEVIQGWDQGVAGMKVGEKRKLVIPAALGYGAKGAGPDIPGGASLTFDVELLRVN